jgi:hypothetical protein
MAAHLTIEQIAGFRARSLAPADLLELDRHVAECESCRNRLYDEVHADSDLHSLRRDLAQHLAYDEVVACAEGVAGAGVRSHLDECSMCREEVADLSRFREELNAPRAERTPTPIGPHPSRWPAVAALAAGVLLVAGLAYWAMDQRPQVAQKLVRPSVPTETALTSEQQQAMQLALSTHKLEQAPILESIVGREGVLLGAPDPAGQLKLTAPIGTTVLIDRPVFHWQPAADATRYVVAVFDEDFRKVAESPTVTATQWQPESALPRGRVLNWQVTATVGGTSVRAPQPPAPEAKFEVVPTEAAATIDAARRDHPSNHLLLAVILAKAGAVDDVANELDALSATDPAMAAALKESLRPSILLSPKRIHPR